MAQMSVESGGFRIVEENLRYSAKRLRQVWPNRFPFANNPTAQGLWRPERRMGQPRRGPKQITGKDNCREFGRMIGVDLVKTRTRFSTRWSASGRQSRSGVKAAATSRQRPVADSAARFRSHR
ncbi:hypothetical protein [Mesorhizobium prunaredense]|nr:hypothetical protein [Mesorhizobium prunaredense]